MKTVFVLSDTHRNRESVDKLMPVMKESDYVLHLGDYVSDMTEYLGELSGKLITVRGNGDFFSRGENEVIMEIEGVKVLISHGHIYDVKRGVERLLSAAEKKGCGLALYGHTHHAKIEDRNGIRLINPGCMTRYSAVKSYAYVIIDKGRIAAKITEII